jgi:hypothetical protein
MDYTTLLYPDTYLQPYLEEALSQEASPADPNEPFADSSCPSNASHIWPSFGPTSFSGMKDAIHSSAAGWGVDAMRMDSAAGPVQIDGLRWNQHDDSARSSSKVYPVESGWSAFDTRSNNTTSSSALPTGDTSDLLLGLRNYDQSAYVPGYYSATINHVLFSPPCSVSLMPLDDLQSCSNSVYPLAQFDKPRPRAFAEALLWPRPDDSTQLLGHTGSHLHLDFEPSSYPLQSQHDMDLDLCYSNNGTTIDLDSISNVPYEPEIEIINSANTRLSCYHDGCKVQFNNVADRKRHLKTIHNEAGQSYMCAYAGCVRAYKVWNRLDSFKNHAKLHKPDDMEALVKKSRKNHDDLRVAITTQRDAAEMQNKRAALASVQIT